MAKDVAAIRIMQMRRQILANLNMLYPSGMRNGSLYATVVCFDESYDQSLFVKDLTYLKNKGYVRYQDEPLGGERAFIDRFCVLTEDGKDVADRIVSDPALEI